MTINIPLDFEEFNALDILVNAEIAELTLNLRRLDPDLKEVRQKMEKYISRLARARDRLARERPHGYVEMIRALRAA